MSAQDKDVKVQEVNDDEAPELMDNAAADHIDTADLQAAQNIVGGKSSKRYAKAMQRMGLKPEAGIFRVTIRKGASQNLAINRTEVYRFPNTNTFVIFGEMSEDSLGGMGMPGASAEAAKAAAAMTGASSSGNAKDSQPAGPAQNGDEDDENVDAGDLGDKEIKLVMSQANVSRSKAIKALKNNNGDIVNTIMELTM